MVQALDAGLVGHLVLSRGRRMSSDVATGKCKPRSCWSLVLLVPAHTQRTHMAMNSALDSPLTLIWRWRQGAAAKSSGWCSAAKFLGCVGNKGLGAAGQAERAGTLMAR
jgi:hypothetical protein